MSGLYRKCFRGYQRHRRKRGFKITNAGSAQDRITLSGFYDRNGYASGAIYIENSFVILQNMILEDNIARFGAGIYATGSSNVLVQNVYSVKIQPRIKA